MSLDHLPLQPDTQWLALLAQLKLATSLSFPCQSQEAEGLAE